MDLLGEKKKQNVIETLWLNYFNDTLFAQGLISEIDYMEMRKWILRRKAQQDWRAIRLSGAYADH